MHNITFKALGYLGERSLKHKLKKSRKYRRSICFHRKVPKKNRSSKNCLIKVWIELENITLMHMLKIK